ncbi:hypothetical protein PTI98_000027 [Pleurotus ostreatus]|nr:hypothetical protein PTI98_000027 [Pleurotus ostreatus]
MVKGNPKSSASSSTRKKHAKKALGTPDQPDTPIREKKPKAKEKGKGKSGSSKKEPRVKMYIPPTKPAPVQPDPLDSMGLAHRLPPDLLVVLRSLGKKAEVTKVRALEELQANWVDRCDDEAVLYVITDMLPVWLHHIPTLFVHPSRRIRLLGASIHAAFLNIASLRDHISLFLADSAPSQLESILGTWCIAAHDVDRAVALNASKSWNAFISRSGRPPPALTLTFEFCQRMVLDPLGTYVYLNPPQPAAAAAPPPAPHARTKAASRHGHGSGHQTPVRQRDDPDAAPRERDDEHEEAEIDRKARLRVGAFGAIGSLLTRCVEEEYEGVDQGGHVLLVNPALWTALFHESSCSVCPTIEAFGEAQPPVRKAAWGLVDALLRLRTLTQGKIDYVRSPPTSNSNSSREGGEQAEGGEGKGDVLSVMSAALLRAAWTEPDPGVRTAMWSPLLGFLRAFPEAWELEARFATTSTTVTAGEGDTLGMGEGSGDEGEEEEEEGEPPPPPPPIPQPSAQSDSPPPSAGYLSFLHFIERGCAGAPVQGYPAVLVVFATVPLSIMASSSPSPLGAVIAAFWGAVESRALSGMQRGAALAAGAAFLESLLECVVFLGKRVHGEGKEGERTLLLGTTASTSTATNTSASTPHEPIPDPITEGGEARLSTLIAAQFVRSLHEIAAGNLKVDPRRAGAVLARGFGRLRGIDEGWYARAWTGFAEAVGEYFLFGGGGEEGETEDQEGRF